MGINARGSIKIINYIISLIIIWFVTYFIYIFFPNSKLVLIFGVLGTICLTAVCKNYKKSMALLDVAIKYRYLISLVFFILCLLFKLHGSSVGIYDKLFVDNNGEYVSRELFGQARWIRSDEFDVQLPYFFSQKYNDYNQVSHQLSLSGQDMIIGYNAPVLSPTLIGKPFTWGYLLFGNELGLSWYWCSKIILFLLVSFELCNLLTQNKYMSLLGSFLIVFSPAMQWWFSPHMYVVFFWASAITVVGYYFFTAKKMWLKILMTALAPCVLVGFVIALFPSCQIPLGLIALVLWIVLLVRDKNKITFVKKDILLLLFIIFVTAVVLGQFLLSAKEGIYLLNNTVYPGKRVSLGGEDGIRDLFTDLTNIFTPFHSTNVLDDCAVSTFNHYGVWSMAMFFVLWNKMKSNNDKQRYVAVTFMVILAVEIIFMLIGFTPIIAKITLFSYINRMKLIYGFTSTLFTIFTISSYLKYKDKTNKKLVLALTLGYLLISFLVIPETSFAYMSSLMQAKIGISSFKLSYLAVIITCVLFVTPLIFLLLKSKMLAVTSTIAIIFISGCLVNPLSSGADSISDHPLSTAVSEAVKEEDGYWLAEGDVYAQNFILANGAKVLNAVNFYPDFDKWKIIDSDLKHSDIYNRYAHIVINFDQSNNEYTLAAPDSMRLKLSFEDIKKWAPRYILTKTDYSEQFKKYGYDSDIIYIDESGYRIYKMSYNN